MKYRALRGVCIGVGRYHMPTDDPVALDAATAQFLTSIGAVAPVIEEVAQEVAEAVAQTVSDVGQTDPAPKAAKAAKGTKK